MKKLLWLTLLLAFLPKAHAGTCPVSAGASWATIKGVITGCASPGTVTFAAGTYTGVNSSVTIPCGVSLSGPVVPYSQTHNQTAILQGSSSNTAAPFNTNTGCSTSQTIQYLEWDGMHPSNAGGFINLAAGTTNINIQNNYLHGVNSSPGTIGPNDLIFFGGNSGSPTTKNVTILNNIFGEPVFADCATEMNDTSNNENDHGGGCGGIGIHNGISNVSVLNNIFHYLEQPMKLFEYSSYNTMASAVGLTVDYNAYSYYSRIAFEAQANIGGSYPTNMTVDYNWIGPRYSSNVADFAFSMANGCGNNLTSTCVTHTDYNVFTESDSSSVDTGAIEVWGESSTNPPSGPNSTTANYNYIQGYIYNGVQWSSSGNFIFNNNFFNIVVGSSSTDQNCTHGTQGNGWWKFEGNGAVYVPTCSGNTYVTSPTSGATGTLTSASPMISPAGGSVASGTVVTIATTGTNRDLNTSNWCTTDGSTPAVHSGTSATMTSYTVTSNTTLKCIGMWGAANQPYSYPTNYGYVPSSVLTANYTTSGTPTAATPAISPASGTFTGSQTVTITDSTPASTIYYTTNGTTPTTGSTVYSGSFAVTTTTTVQAIAAASGYLNSAVGSATYTLSGTPTAATPTFSPASETFTSPISVTVSTTTTGATIYYTTDGTIPTTSSTVYSSAIPLTTTTIIKALAVATGYINSAVGSSAYTYSPPTLTGCYQGNVGGINTVHIANSIQQHVYCSYSSGTSPLDCSTTDANGSAVTAWGATNGNITVGAIGSGSAGLVTGITTGTANSTATVNGTKSCSAWTWTVTNSPPTLQSVTISLQAGGANIAIGTPSQACANMTYTGPIVTQVCGSGSDAYGTTPTGWASSAPGTATISTSGLLNGVSAGMTNISVSAGSFTSPALGITVNPAVGGTNVTLQGVRLTGSTSVQ